MRIDKRCLVCPLGVKECIRRIIVKVGLKPRKLRPGHPWATEWCPYLRGFRPTPEALKLAEEALKKWEESLKAAQTAQQAQAQAQA